MYLKHGECYSRLNNTWRKMRSRCRNEKLRDFPNYGGRGISVCEEWEDFSVFREWAINNGYDDSLTIDRIDVDGNYCPDNCRWIPKSEQSRNRRNVRPVDVYKDGELVGTYPSQIDASIALDVPKSSICNILHGRRKFSKGFSFKYHKKGR